MSDGERLLIVATCTDRAMADYVNTSVRDSSADAGVTIDALVMIDKDHDGKVHTQEKGDLSPKDGAIRGGIAGAVFGLVFPPSIIASAIVGGTIAAVAARLRDSGVPADELQKIGEGMQNGASAVLFLRREQDRDFVHRFLASAKSITERSLPGSLAVVIGA